MKRSQDRILTTHAGSLSRPESLIELNRVRSEGGKIDETSYAAAMAAAVAAIVQKQRDLGIDILDDGEFGKPMSQTYDYGVWWNYAYERMGGFVRPESVPESEHKKSSVADIALTTMNNRRDWQKFGEFYQDPQSTGLVGSAARRPTRRPVCTEPITYTGQAALQASIDNLKNAMAAAGVEEGFMCSVAPASFARGEDLHYSTEEEFVFASAEAMRTEYKAIVDSGLILQIDDPSLPDNWDMINPEPPLEEFKKFAMVRIEALNYALRDLPEDRIRFHICWGSWHGPHTTDIPLKDIIDLLLCVNAGAYSVEAGNVRHEHEWRVWRNGTLPEGKLLIPGVVSHATNVVEHPQVVADRIVKYAGVVGRENVLAGTDCGLGGRIHPQIAWAKLEALASGADIASKELWN
ncbi:MAG: methionine synthase [Betaproteobacteria bacterium RIFCSPLOWO2_12_FULL_63_13]|nr:MAG: methionine synthase [Betaproteobacteria bacterium RIFCSPLOWO2_02_FULL_63_19]OGA51096.1 MAG: methionine synthase [Betaproteobacteria bacterium RIFCSPLOWO2_12_FULL_63_13]